MHMDNFLNSASLADAKFDQDGRKDGPTIKAGPT